MVPPAYGDLVATWGPGWLGDVFELPLGPRLVALNDAWRVHGPRKRAAGHWPQIGEDEAPKVSILGVARNGLAVAARADASVVLLHPKGHVIPCGSFEELVANMTRDLAPEARTWRTPKNPIAVAREHYFEGRKRPAGASDERLHAPSIYVTEAAPHRARILEALAADDEPAADAIFAEMLGVTMPLYTLSELMVDLSRTELALRQSWIDQAYRLLKRRVPGIGEEISPKEGRGLEVHSLREAPAGIFVDLDDVEATFLRALVAAPDDEATLAVYADHLEARGRLDRADGLRRPVVAALADAAERGFVPPLGVKPVDGAAFVAGLLETWKAEDPSADTRELAERIGALHPGEREGYALLVSQLRGDEREPNVQQAMTHLLRERGRAWPMLVLALRAPRLSLVVELFREAPPSEALWWLLSICRHPSEHLRAYLVEDLALVYAENAAVDLSKVEDFVPYLDPSTTAVLEVHRPRPPSLGLEVLREIAFRLLYRYPNDERIFAGYLHFFADAAPWSEEVMRKRKKDPRIIPALRVQLAEEERGALRAQTSRSVEYRPQFGVLARYLARLGDEEGKAARDRFNASERRTRAKLSRF